MASLCCQEAGGIQKQNEESQQGPHKGVGRVKGHQQGGVALSPGLGRSRHQNRLEGWLQERAAREPFMAPALRSAAWPMGRRVRVCGASFWAPAAKWFHLVGPDALGFC